MTLSHTFPPQHTQTLALKHMIFPPFLSHRVKQQLFIRSNPSEPFEEIISHMAGGMIPEFGYWFDRIDLIKNGFYELRFVLLLPDKEKVKDDPERTRMYEHVGKVTKPIVFNFTVFPGPVDRIIVTPKGLLDNRMEIGTTFDLLLTAMDVVRMRADAEEKEDEREKNFDIEWTLEKGDEGPCGRKKQRLLYIYIYIYI